VLTAVVVVWLTSALWLFSVAGLHQANLQFCEMQRYARKKRMLVRPSSTHSDVPSVAGNGFEVSLCGRDNTVAIEGQRGRRGRAEPSAATCIRLVTAV